MSVNDTTNRILHLFVETSGVLFPTHQVLKILKCRLLTLCLCVFFFFFFSLLQTSSSSSTPEAGDGPHETPIPDPFDLEFDRFNGGALADLEASVRPPRQPLDPLSRPVDLEFEMDRDDPEAVDIDQLYESPDEEGDEEEMGMSVKEAVDLDDEYDL